jgi:fumarylacetoacetase
MKAYGVFSTGDGRQRVGLGDGLTVTDLTGASPLFDGGSLDGLLAAGPEAWERVHQVAASHPGPVHSLDSVTTHLPCRFPDYVDFYSSIHHAVNVGRILRPGSEPLPPNWRHLPIGYHGRSGTIVVDGTPIRRPAGQRGPGDFGPTLRLDFELEVGFITGGRAGPIPVEECERHIFGLVLVNDWSARDLQAWEYQPLGPFLGKSFATTVSPWVVPLFELAGRRLDPPAQDPPPLPYLTPPGSGIDLPLRVTVNGTTVTRSNYRHLYWTISQQLAHATSNGASISPGDLFASGTISGPTTDSLGCLLEMGGPYLADGDTVTISSLPVFGTCSGTVVGTPVT